MRSYINPLLCLALPNEKSIIAIAKTMCATTVFLLYSIYTRYNQSISYWCISWFVHLTRQALSPWAACMNTSESLNKCSTLNLNHTGHIRFWQAIEAYEQALEMFKSDFQGTQNEMWVYQFPLLPPIFGASRPATHIHGPIISQIFKYYSGKTRPGTLLMCIHPPPLLSRLM